MFRRLLLVLVAMSATGPAVLISPVSSYSTAQPSEVRTSWSTLGTTVPTGVRLRIDGKVVTRRVARRVRLERHTDKGWVLQLTGQSRRSGRVSFRFESPIETTLYRITAPSRRASVRVRVPGNVVHRRVRLRAWAGSPVTVPGTRTTATPAPTPTGTPTPTPLDTPWVSGYYVGWFWDAMYPPELVDMAAMTHFVFGRIAPGGGSLEGEPDDPTYPDFPYAPGDVVPGAGTAHRPGLAPDGGGRSVEDYLVARAHAAGTKALVMLGGDGLDGRGFMLSTADDVRPQFVNAIVDYLVAHGYDGVDVDWENCLEGESGCGEGDGEDPVTATEAHRRLLALVNDIRTEAATRPRFQTTPVVITHPGYALNTNDMLEDGRAPTWRADVAKAVDQYNLMSYGIGTTMNGGGWQSWFSGALTGAKPRHPVDIASSVDAYVAAGVPRHRLGLGIGFFGTYFGPSITGPRQDTSVNSIWETNDVALRYAELDRMGYLDHGNPAWDDVARSTYRTYEAYGEAGYVPPRNPEGPRDHLMSPAGFLTYEDARSIAAKAQWSRTTGLGGAMLWTINYGWLPDADANPLLDSVKHEFLGR